MEHVLEAAKRLSLLATEPLSRSLLTVGAQVAAPPNEEVLAK